MTLQLTDDLGKPVAGEATFWMVDQAVLSLAKERPLDPLAELHRRARRRKMAARDTRNMAFGIIPLEEAPGGDAGLDEWGTDNNVSVRKNFTPVPIYLPKVDRRPGRRREDKGEAAGFADRLQAAREGDQRARTLRLRDRRNADPPGPRRAAGAAALRAQRRLVRRRLPRHASSRGRREPAAPALRPRG